MHLLGQNSILWETRGDTFLGLGGSGDKISSPCHHFEPVAWRKYDYPQLATWYSYLSFSVNMYFYQGTFFQKSMFLSIFNPWLQLWSVCQELPWAAHCTVWSSSSSSSSFQNKCPNANGAALPLSPPLNEQRNSQSKAPPPPPPPLPYNTLAKREGGEGEDGGRS